MLFVKKYDFSSTSMFKGSTDVTLTRLQELDSGMDRSELQGNVAGNVHARNRNSNNTRFSGDVGAGNASPVTGIGVVLVPVRKNSFAIIDSGF